MSDIQETLKENGLIENCLKNNAISSKYTEHAQLNVCLSVVEYGKTVWQIFSPKLVIIWKVIRKFN